MPRSAARAHTGSVGVGRAQERADGWGLLAFVGAGFLGGAVALAFVYLGSGGFSILDATSLSFIMMVATVAGGVLAGWFVAVLVLSRARGEVRCPRCGTANDRTAVSCGACGL